MLGRFGVAGAIAAPRLEIFHEGTLVASNTGWTRGDAGGIAAAAARAGAFALATDAADSAALVTLAPGSYTAVINATDGRTGVGLLEVYDPSPDTPAPRLSNLSVRAFAGSGADTLIVGFVVRGDTPQRMLLRAIGPTLAQFGVSGALARPQLTVYSGADAIARNTGWPDSPDRGAITEAAARVGAFALPANSTDAVLLLELAPGAYTAQVAGAEGATGVALVEAYDLR